MSFPITLATPVRFAATLPAAADVVIVGGGIAGIMTAWFLAERGLRAVVCEKGRVAGEQSSRNWGWIRQQGRDPAELPIMVEALSIWQALSREIGAGLGFRQAGVTYLAATPREIAGFEDWLPHAAAHGLDTRLLSAREVAAMFPAARAGWTGALHTPSDAMAEPWGAVRAIAAALADRGTAIVEDCAVRAIDIAAGRVAGVVTERGRIACDQVVVAAGAWSRLFLGAHGIAIPQLSVLSSVAATVPLSDVHAGAACDARFAFRRRADGGYSIAPGSAHSFFLGPDAFRSVARYLPVLRKDFRSTRFRLAAPRGFPDAWRTPRRWDAGGPTPFERMRILDPAPDLAALAAVRDAFATAFPGVGRPALAAAWGGMIDTMPDVVPVIDRAALPGVVIATGLSGHGFGIGPGIGRVVADLVAGRPPGHDLARFRLSRFSDGSPTTPGPSL